LKKTVGVFFPFYNLKKQDEF